MRLSILGLLACIAISFTACEKNTVLTPDVLEDNSPAAKLSTVIENQENRAKKGTCFKFSGEVTYLLPDGTSITGEQSVAKAEVKAWYEANPDAEEKATLQFPVEIILEDETVHSNRAKCFEFNGEITYLLPDGSSITGVYPAIKTELKAWREANPDSEEKPSLQFPVEIIFDDEMVSTINNREELMAAKAACKN